MRGARCVVLVGVLVLLAACSDSSGDASPPTTARESTRSTESATVEDADLAFQPVLASGPCGPFSGVPDQRSELCYELGDPVSSERMLEAAEAVLSPAAEFAVHLTLTTEGIERFNELAASCFAHAPSCPSGQVAVVSGGQVVSAPTVIAESFERDQIQLSGAWTREEADALATQILGG